MAGGAPVLVVASAARTANGNSGILLLPERGELLHILIAVSAVSGTTPSMTPSLSWSDDGTAATLVPADPTDAMTALTATPGALKTFQVRGQWYQINWTITGTTPSFTFAAYAYVTGAP